MSEKPLPPAKQQLDDLDRILTEMLDGFNAIARQEIETASTLPEAVQEEQAATYQGTSEHSSFLDQLAEKEEERDLFRVERDKLAFDLEQQKFNERFDLHELRRTYTPYLFYMTVGWLIFVAALVIASAAGWSRLTELVLIALITTTTTNIIGMFVIAARWLFPSKHK